MSKNSGIKSFIMEQLNSGGMLWHGKEKDGIFKIPWPRNPKNKTRNGTLHSNIYIEYAKYTKKYNAAIPDCKYKENLRNALNKAANEPDGKKKNTKPGFLEDMKHLLKQTGEPFLMYRFKQKGGTSVYDHSSTSAAQTDKIPIQAASSTNGPVSCKDNIPTIVAREKDISGFEDSMTSQLQHDSTDENLNGVGTSKTSTTQIANIGACTPGNRSLDNSNLDIDAELNIILNECQANSPLPEDLQNMCNSTLDIDTLPKESVNFSAGNATQFKATMTTMNKVQAQQIYPAEAVPTIGIETMDPSTYQFPMPSTFQTQPTSTPSIQVAATRSNTSHLQLHQTSFQSQSQIPSTFTGQPASTPAIQVAATSSNTSDLQLRQTSIQSQLPIFNNSRADLSSQNCLVCCPTLSPGTSLNTGENIYNDDIQNQDPLPTKHSQNELTSSQDGFYNGGPMLFQSASSSSDLQRDSQSSQSDSSPTGHSRVDLPSHSSTTSLMSISSENRCLQGSSLARTDTTSSRGSDQYLKCQNSTTLDPSGLEAVNTDVHMASMPSSFDSDLFSNLSDHLGSLNVTDVKDTELHLRHECSMTGNEFLINVFYCGNFIDSHHIENQEGPSRIRIFSGQKAIKAFEENHEHAREWYGDPNSDNFQFHENTQKIVGREKDFKKLMDTTTRPIILELKDSKIYCTRLCRVGLYHASLYKQTPIKVVQKQPQMIFDMIEFNRHLEENLSNIDPTVYLTVGEKTTYDDRNKALISIRISSCDALNKLGFTTAKETEGPGLFISEETPSNESEQRWTPKT